MTDDDTQQTRLDELPCGHARVYAQDGECLLCDPHVDADADREAMEGVLR